MGLREGGGNSTQQKWNFPTAKTKKKRPQIGVGVLFFGECFIGPDSCFFLLPMNWSEQQNNKPFNVSWKLLFFSNKDLVISWLLK